MSITKWSKKWERVPYKSAIHELGVSTGFTPTAYKYLNLYYTHTIEEPGGGGGRQGPQRINYLALHFDDYNVRAVESTSQTRQPRDSEVLSTSTTRHSMTLCLDNSSLSVRTSHWTTTKGGGESFLS